MIEMTDRAFGPPGPVLITGGTDTLSHGWSRDSLNLITTYTRRFAI